MSEIREHVPLANVTTFHIGGNAEKFVSITQEEEILPVLHFAHREGLPVHILGGGSNILVSDAGVKGVVLQIMLKGVRYEEKGNEVFVTAEAGEHWDDLVAYTVEKGWWGIENLSYIPGTVGASPIQNIGAYGVEVSQVIHEVRVINMNTLSVEVFTKDQCHFSYRDSYFKSHPHYIILSVTYRLLKFSNPNIQYADLKHWFCERRHMTPSVKEIREAVVAIRTKKFPDLSMAGTAGSFFKNPIVSKELATLAKKKYPEMAMWELDNGMVKISAAWLIDHVAMMKGEREGDAGTWNAQALVLVNYGKATQKDISNFADKIRARVFERTGIVLEQEVVMMK